MGATVNFEKTSGATPYCALPRRDGCVRAGGNYVRLPAAERQCGVYFVFLECSDAPGVVDSKP